jgi:acetate kinase
MSPEDALVFGLRDGDEVRVEVRSEERTVVFGDVSVRVHPSFRLEMHLDTDEANAALVGSGAQGFIDSIQHRRG